MRTTDAQPATDTQPSAPTAPGEGWTDVCAVDDIVPDTGVAAWVDGHQIAVFRLADGQVLAIDHHDPLAGANVLARGIVGDADGQAVVASPLHKQRYVLTTGVCLDADVAVATHPVRVGGDGRIAVRRGER